MSKEERIHRSFVRRESGKAFFGPAGRPAIGQRSSMDHQPRLETCEPPWPRRWRHSLEGIVGNGVPNVGFKSRSSHSSKPAGWQLRVD